ncbi:hypothetical protein CEXT_182721 [Caerostris extrusa]|uniref:Uncharacterized protein n=1 Tax=Caerostris extrusa TaxID=172846 RepID=A0AAV4YAZ7_CAEEX|nr:hypothetical protein CEXT_182721 [Caerostris extrusa]
MKNIFDRATKGVGEKDEFHGPGALFFPRVVAVDSGEKDWKSSLVLTSSRSPEKAELCRYACAQSYPFYAKTFC